VPRTAITMGVGTILEARRCLLLAIGPEKANIVAQAIEGPLTRMVTASALQLHSSCTFVLDGPAAAQLQKSGSYQHGIPGQSAGISLLSPMGTQLSSSASPRASLRSSPDTP